MCHVFQDHVWDPSLLLRYAVLLFKETPLSGLPFSYLSLLAGITLALHPLPPDAEGFLRHNPRLQYWEVAGDHSTTPCESGQSNALFLLPFFFLHQMPTYIWTYLLFCWFIFHFLNTSSLLLFIYILQTKSKPHPCECVCVSSMSLISTWACCLLLRRSGSENKQSSSYLAWAGKVDSAEQAAPGGRGGRAQDWTLVVSSPPHHKKWRQHGQVES